MTTNYTVLTSNPEACLDDLREKLDYLSSIGLGKTKVLIYDPESDDWETITGLTYDVNSDYPVKLYSDLP